MERCRFWCGGIFLLMLCRFPQHDKFPLKSVHPPIKSDVFVDIGFGVLGPTLAQ